MIAIIDYGVGNLFSLKSSLAAIGREAVVTGDRAVLRAASQDRKSTRLNSSHTELSRMPSSA